MNPVTVEPPLSFSCNRHPIDNNNNSTGFCPSCLFERLSIPTAFKSRNQPHKQLEEEEDVNKYQVRDSEEVRDMSDLENDILEMEAKIDAIVHNLKSMNDKIDLDAHPKKHSKSSNFWSKKWQKWRSRKKNRNDVVSSSKLHHDETRSEVVGLGRRSCDTGPRFSLDVGRVSVEEQEPKDGYLVGDVEPGGSTQTREYYLNCSSRRRKGLERSNSTIVDNSNAKDYNQIHRRLKFHSIGGEKELSLALALALAGDANNNDGSESLGKKTWWWNWKGKGKVWGNHTSKTDRSIEKQETRYK